MTEIHADYEEGVKYRLDADRPRLKIVTIMDLARAILDTLEYFRQDPEGYQKELYGKEDFAYQALLRTINTDFMKDLKAKED